MVQLISRLDLLFISFCLYLFLVRSSWYNKLQVFEVKKGNAIINSGLVFIFFRFTQEYIDLTPFKMMELFNLSVTM